MSPPIRDGSGSSIGSIRLGDGSEISEVRTGAGDVLFSGNTIPDSVIYQHKIDAGSGTVVDADVGTVTGTTNGTWQSDPNSVGGSHLYLNSSNSENIDFGDQTIPSQLSVSLWVNFQSLPSSGASYVWDFGVNDGVGGLSISYQTVISAIEINEGGNKTDTGFVPNTNQWYHFGLTYASDSSLIFYVDGTVNTNTTSGDGTLTDTNRNLLIGEAGFGGKKADILADDHYVADSALSQSEINDLKSNSPRE